MITEKTLQQELKRYKRFIKEAIKEGSYDEVYRLSIECDTIIWILEEDI